MSLLDTHIVLLQIRKILTFNVKKLKLFRPNSENIFLVMIFSKNAVQINICDLLMNKKCFNDIMYIFTVHRELCVLLDFTE